MTLEIAYFSLFKWHFISILHLHRIQHVDCQLVTLLAPSKRYFCYIKYCISICKFSKNILGGQTRDKISHTKRKKNNKTTSKKPCWIARDKICPLSYYCLFLASLGLQVRFCIVSEILKTFIIKFSLFFVYLIKF